MIPGDLLELAGAFPEAILLVAEDGGVLGANRAAQELLPTNHPASLTDLVTDPREKVNALLRRCLSAREPTPAALQFRGRAGAAPIDCRCEGALARLSRDGSPAVAMLRLFPKQALDNRFAVLTEKIEALNREIGQRKRAEAGLNQQRRLLETTLASIGDAVIATDREGRITFMNGVAEQFTGWKRTEAAGLEFERVFRIAGEASGEPLESPAAIVFREQRPVELANHAVLVSQDGRRTPIADSAAPIRDADGNVHGVILVFRDVTASKRASDELRLSEERFRTLADSAPVLIWRADTAKLCTYFNKQWLDFRGRAMEQELGHGWTEGVHPDDLEHCLSVYSASFETHTSFQMEFRMRRWDGRYHWLLDSGVPHFLGSGGFAGFIGTCLDIDDRKRMEAALALAAGRFRVALHESPISVFNQDLDLRYTWIHNSDPGLATSLLGHTESDVFPPEIATRLTEIKRETIASGERRRFEISIPMESGERTYDTTIEPLRDELGLIAGITGASVDVTERKLAERHLVEQARELARSNADLQQFAYITSHDLQEPLRMIGSYAQLLAKRYGGTLDASAGEFLGYIVQGAERMRSLINDLLTFSKLGSSERVSKPVEMDGVLHWARMNLEPVLRESGAEVSAPLLPELPGDQVQLVQLFQNLIGNAVKYRGSEPPRVRVGVERRGAEWLFSVADNGIEIDPAYHQRIFGLFKRLHGQEVPGTGIGLTICRRVVENHGGEIWVESSEGQGSTFYFTLPAGA